MVKRKTWQREAVREALAGVEGFISAQSLHQRLRQADSTIGLATVYRAVIDLVGEGEVDSLQSPDGESLYRACTPSHHHHLICKNCGLTVEIEADDAEKWARSVAATHGFVEAQHVIDVFGLCPSCARTRAPRPVADTGEVS